VPFVFFLKHTGVSMVRVNVIVMAMLRVGVKRFFKNPLFESHSIVKKNDFSGGQLYTCLFNELV